MPGLVVEEIDEGAIVEESNGEGNSTNLKDTAALNKSPDTNSSPKNPPKVGTEYDAGVAVDTSIEKLYENVCEMQSSDQSLSRPSLGSDGEESRIDSELRHLVGGERREVEIMEEEEEDEEVKKPGDMDRYRNSGLKPGDMDSYRNSGLKEESSSGEKRSHDVKKPSESQVDSEATSKSSSSPRSKLQNKPRPDDKQSDKFPRKPLSTKMQRSSPFGLSKFSNGTDNTSETGLVNPDLGPYLLKQARDLISSGDNLRKALDYALRAALSFQKSANGEKPSLDLVMCLHVTAAIYSNLGQYSEAIRVLEESIAMPVVEEGPDHALARFAGHMQLGDTYAMLGQLENSLLCYTSGLEVQRQVLGDSDARVGETCRYLAEARVQALQFDEAEKLCQMALDIHRENGSPASLEEAADRRLMGLICETKGNYENALEHLVLASMAMAANGQEDEVASVDLSIGDTYLSLSRYDEAVFAYQKALAALKSSKGENHPAVASVFVRLADLFNKTGKLKESKSYCENALRIYEKPAFGIPPEEIAGGLTDVSAIYESMNELDQALRLLKKALRIYDNAPGQQNTIAGIEAQMGVMYYMLGNFSESYASFKNAISKLRASGEKKSSFFGIALNQMGLTCVQRFAINEAVELFEEARCVLEQEYGPYHPDTLAVYSNLAGTYDAVGRLDEAIEILERVVGMREEKLGTANPDVDDEKKRLAELLKEAGRVRNRKARSLENLLDANPHTPNNDAVEV